MSRGMGNPFIRGVLGGIPFLYVALAWDAGLWCAVFAALAVVVAWQSFPITAPTSHPTKEAEMALQDDILGTNGGEGK